MILTGYEDMPDLQFMTAAQFEKEILRVVVENNWDFPSDDTRLDYERLNELTTPYFGPDYTARERIKEKEHELRTSNNINIKCELRAKFTPRKSISYNMTSANQKTRLPIFKRLRG